MFEASEGEENKAKHYDVGRVLFASGTSKGVAAKLTLVVVFIRQR